MLLMLNQPAVPQQAGNVVEAQSRVEQLNKLGVNAEPTERRSRVYKFC